MWAVRMPTHCGNVNYNAFNQSVGIKLSGADETLYFFWESIASVFEVNRKKKWENQNNIQCRSCVEKSVQQNFLLSLFFKLSWQHKTWICLQGCPSHKHGSVCISYHHKRSSYWLVSSTKAFFALEKLWRLGTPLLVSMLTIIQSPFQTNSLLISTFLLRFCFLLFSFYLTFLVYIFIHFVFNFLSVEGWRATAESALFLIFLASECFLLNFLLNTSMFIKIILCLQHWWVLKNCES